MTRDSHRLQKTVEMMQEPLRRIPYSAVIESLYGHKVIPFDPSSPESKNLLKKLERAANKAANEINKTGIRKRRANEVGNAIEPYVLNALKSVGLEADTPSTKSGKKRSTGYPDLCFSDPLHANKLHYVECKTFNEKNVNSTLRSFYFSPSDDPKITTDGHHFAISFQMETYNSDGELRIYECTRWKVFSLENLCIDVKYEFNADNRRLYDSEMKVVEGKVKD